MQANAYRVVFAGVNIWSHVTVSLSGGQSCHFARVNRSVSKLGVGVHQRGIRRLPEAIAQDGRAKFRVRAIKRILLIASFVEWIQNFDVTTTIMSMTGLLRD